MSSASNVPARNSSHERSNDDALIDLWLHGRSEHTQVNYRVDIEQFRDIVAKPFEAVDLADVQFFSDELHDRDLAPATVRRKLTAVRSFFRFAVQEGILDKNPARSVRLPRVKDTLGERILTEEQVIRMVMLEPNRRNRVLIRLLYVTGARVSELCALTWKDTHRVEDDLGQVTLFGKRGKTRSVLVRGSTWQELMALRGVFGADAPVFRSAKRSTDGSYHLTPRHVWHIVRHAGERAEIEGGVSPHWLRHSHASHALDRGTPIHVVQRTLGHEDISTTGRYAHARPDDSSSLNLPL